MNHKLWLICCCLLALLLSVSFAAGAFAQEDSKYCNSRFRFCVSYPKGLKMQPPPANDDGRQFQGADGFLMTASGINNVLDGTLKSELADQKTEFDKITYQKAGTDWYALSGFKGSEVLYLKTFVGKGSINHLYISYPVSRKAQYDKIVEGISKSFTPGPLNTAH
jgi:hypothetical protein